MNSTFPAMGLGLPARPYVTGGLGILVPGLFQVGDTVQLLWNLEAHVGDTLQAEWHVLTVVGDGQQYPWNVLIVAGADPSPFRVQFYWDVRAPSGDEVTAQWRVIKVLLKMQTSSIEGTDETTTTGGYELV